MKKEKGITLIALVVTIIVLIILAGVSINLVLGENGIITKAKKAAEDTKKAQIEEQMELCKLEASMNNIELKDVLIDKGMISEEELETSGICKINNDEKNLVISNSNGLKVLSNSVNNGNDYLGVVIYLLNDIKFDTTFNSETGELQTGEKFEPIGNSDEYEFGAVYSLEGTIFNGMFDGLNHTIENLYINTIEENRNCTGLFGYVGPNGIVKNIIIKNSYISGNETTGSIAGRSRGTIKNCTSYAKVVANRITGGIVGRTSRIIEDCINYGNIYTTNIQTGGIVGNCDFGENIIINNCKNYGDITSTSNTIGGIVGGAYRGTKDNKNVNVTISNCENYGNIGELANNYTEIGGIVGHSRAILKNCINNGDVKGYQNVGGIVGKTWYYNSTSTLIENSINKGRIEGTESRIGGICGFNTGGTILKCNNSGEVSLTGPITYWGVAGIAGGSGSDTNDTKIEQCYNEGKITLELSNTKSRQIAGIVGNMGMDTEGTYTGYILNCYNKGEIVSTGSATTLSSAGIINWGRHIVVKNCYNVGILTSVTATSKGINVATELDVTFENNYWLDTCGANYGIGTKNSNVGAEPITSNELKNLAETLGDTYTSDTTNINNGYPILKWQLKK